jgi:hypothetical protein
MLYYLIFPFQSIAVSVCTASFNNEKFYTLPALHLYVLYISQNKL